MTEVVAALIVKDGKFLICQRPRTKSLAYKWEFVGGKVEKGETGEAALIRECREELGMSVAVQDKFTEVTHTYPDITVHLTLYRSTIAEGEPHLLEHEAMAWITPDEIENYEFCAADTDILNLIKEKWGSLCDTGN